MGIARNVRCNIAERTPSTLDTPGQLIDGLPVYRKTVHTLQNAERYRQRRAIILYVRAWYTFPSYLKLDTHLEPGAKLIRTSLRGST
jgi:hypothetical protein